MILTPSRNPPRAIPKKQTILHQLEELTLHRLMMMNIRCSRWHRHRLKLAVDIPQRILEVKHNTNRLWQQPVRNRERQQTSEIHRHIQRHNLRGTSISNIQAMNRGT